MIAQLQGQVIEHEDKALIVDVNGVGYRVVVMPKSFSKAGVGAEVVLFTYHSVSNDMVRLFGFLEREDLKHFELLLTVPSVGPMTAMNILEVAPPDTLAQAVSQNDTALLTKVSGVGRKTAERILVELREKIGASKMQVVSGTVQHEALSALVSIGFSSAQARDAVSKLPNDVKSVEEAVKEALKMKD